MVSNEMPERFVVGANLVFALVSLRWAVAARARFGYYHTRRLRHAIYVDF